ncbi:hypothetical protein D3C75_807660 [compost metagenome]
MMAVVVLDDSAVAVEVRIEGHRITARRGVVHFIVLDDRILRAPYPQRHVVSGSADMGVVHHIMLNNSPGCI